MTFLSVTKTSKEDYVPLEQMPYIYYPLHFWKNTVGVRALIDSDNKVIAITPAYALKVGLKLYHTNIGAHKIDGCILKTFEIVLISFQVEDKIGRGLFFSRNFLIDQYQCECSFRYVFPHLQQCRRPVCREETYLKVLHHLQGSTNYQADGTHQ